ncbi:MAG: arylesterase [Methylophaga sp.]|nr:arylesterase [Methylophaga sp.]
MVKTLKTMLYALFLITFITGCDNAPPLNKLSDDAVILAFGDSLTYGTGAGKTEDYPALLQASLSQLVINAGVPGEISGEGRARLPELLAQVQPQFVILCHGGNDLIRKLNHQQIKKNLANMIETILASGAQVLLVAVPEPNILLSPPDFYQELADEYQLNLEANIITDILSSPELKSDPIHPNAIGYRLMAEAILLKLAESGAVTVEKLSL